MFAAYRSEGAAPAAAPQAPLAESHNSASSRVDGSARPTGNLSAATPPAYAAPLPSPGSVSSSSSSSSAEGAPGGHDHDHDHGHDRRRHREEGGRKGERHKSKRRHSHKHGHRARKRGRSPSRSRSPSPAALPPPPPPSAHGSLGGELAWLIDRTGGRYEGTVHRGGSYGLAATIGATWLLSKRERALLLRPEGESREAGTTTGAGAGSGDYYFGQPVPAVEESLGNRRYLHPVAAPSSTVPSSRAPGRPLWLDGQDLLAGGDGLGSGRVGRGLDYRDCIPLATTSSAAGVEAGRHPMAIGPFPAPWESRSEHSLRIQQQVQGCVAEPSAAADARLWLLLASATAGKEGGDERLVSICDAALAACPGHVPLILTRLHALGRLGVQGLGARVVDGAPEAGVRQAWADAVRRHGQDERVLHALCQDRTAMEAVGVVQDSGLPLPASPYCTLLLHAVREQVQGGRPWAGGAILQAAWEWCTALSQYGKTYPLPTLRALFHVYWESEYPRVGDVHPTYGHAYIRLAGCPGAWGKEEAGARAHRQYCREIAGAGFCAWMQHVSSSGSGLSSVLGPGQGGAGLGRKGKASRRADAATPGTATATAAGAGTGTATAEPVQGWLASFAAAEGAMAALPMQGSRVSAWCPLDGPHHEPAPPPPPPPAPTPIPVPAPPAPPAASTDPSAYVYVYSSEHGYRIPVLRSTLLMREAGRGMEGEEGEEEEGQVAARQGVLGLPMQAVRQSSGRPAEALIQEVHGATQGRLDSLADSIRAQKAALAHGGGKREERRKEWRLQPLTGRADERAQAVKAAQVCLQALQSLPFPLQDYLATPDSYLCDTGVGSGASGPWEALLHGLGLLENVVDQRQDVWLPTLSTPTPTPSTLPAPDESRQIDAAFACAYYAACALQALPSLAVPVADLAWVTAVPAATHTLPEQCTLLALSALAHLGVQVGDTRGLPVGAVVAESLGSLGPAEVQGGSWPASCPVLHTVHIHPSALHDTLCVQHARRWIHRALLLYHQLGQQLPHHAAWVHWWERVLQAFEAAVTSGHGFMQQKEAGAVPPMSALASLVLQGPSGCTAPVLEQHMTACAETMHAALGQGGVPSQVTPSTANKLARKSMGEGAALLAQEVQHVLSSHSLPLLPAPSPFSLHALLQPYPHPCLPLPTVILASASLSCWSSPGMAGGRGMALTMDGLCAGLAAGMQVLYKGVLLHLSLLRSMTVPGEGIDHVSAVAAILPSSLLLPGGWRGWLAHIGGGGGSSHAAPTGGSGTDREVLLGLHPQARHASVAGLLTALGLLHEPLPTPPSDTPLGQCCGALTRSLASLLSCSLAWLDAVQRGVGLQVPHHATRVWRELCVLLCPCEGWHWDSLVRHEGGVRGMGRAVVLLAQVQEAWRRELPQAHRAVLTVLAEQAMVAGRAVERPLASPPPGSPWSSLSAYHWPMGTATGSEEGGCVQGEESRAAAHLLRKWLGRLSAGRAMHTGTPASPTLRRPPHAGGTCCMVVVWAWRTLTRLMLVQPHVGKGVVHAGGIWERGMQSVQGASGQVWLASDALLALGPYWAKQEQAEEGMSGALDR